MASKSGAIRIEFFGHDRTMGKTFDAQWRKADTFQKKLALMSTRLSAMGRKMTMAVTLPIAAGLTMATKAAMEENAQMEMLDKIVRQNTGATKEQVAGLERWIAAQQKASTFSDGQLRPAVQELTAVTKDLGEAQDLTTVAMDIAAAKGKDVKTIAEALAKAYTGNIGLLSRYGIQTRDASGEVMGFAKVMKNAQKTYGGAAAKALDTTAGRVTNLKNRFADMGEDIGRAFIPMAERAAEFIAGLAGEIEGLSASSKSFILNAALVAAAVGPVLWTLGKLSGATVVAIGSVARLTATFGALNAALRVGGITAFGTTLMASLGPIGLVTAGIVAAGGLIYALNKLRNRQDYVTASAEEMKRTMERVQADTGDLQKWADRALGGHLEVQKGELVWKPAVAVEPETGEGIVEWVHRTAAEERKAIREEALDTQIEYAKSAAETARVAFETAEAQLGGPIHSTPAQRQAVEAQKRSLETLSLQLAGLLYQRRELEDRFTPIEVKASIKDFEAEIAKAEGRVEHFANLPPEKRTAEVLLKEQRAKQKLSRLRGDLEAFTEQNWTVLIEAEIKKTQKDLGDMETALEELNKRKSTPKIEAEKEKLEKAIADAKQRLRELRDTKTKPKAELVDNISAHAEQIRRNVESLFGTPIYQHVKVVKDGQDIPQAYGGSYLLNRATSFIAGEAGREVAAFFPLSDPSRSRAIFAQLQTQLGGILGTGSGPARASAPVHATPAAAAAAGGNIVENYNVVLPGGTALVGTAEQVARLLAPHITRYQREAGSRRGRRH